MKRTFIAMAAALSFLTACNKTAQPADTTNSETIATNNVEIKELGNEEFAQLVGNPEKDGKHWHFVSNKPIIVDFYATWCGPCKKMAPNIQQLANEYDGKINVYKVDVDKAKESAAMFGFNSIPTLLFVNPSNGQLSIVSGYQEYSSLKSYIKESLGL